MQMQSTYWLQKVLKMISLYVSALLCTLQHIVIHAMQLSGVNSRETYAHVSLRDGGPVFRAPFYSSSGTASQSFIKSISRFTLECLFV
jgi:hypothetical protein